ncbi:type II secretion system protein [Paraburkholderia rhizosphaerae]
MMVLLITLGVGRLLENMRISGQRTREADLLYIGGLYRNAIRQYVLATPVGSRRYPEKLDDLLRDPRYPVTRRYLRALYPDPITGEPFMSIASPEGGVRGVQSMSQQRPLKTTGFDVDNASFARASRYQDWQFVDAR